MQHQVGNTAATKGGGESMEITPCLVRGEPRWKIEIGGADGKRKRQFLKSPEAAEKALKAAKKDRADVGRAWEVLTAKEKAVVMQILKEIQAAGFTLEQVWNTAKALPQAPVSGCTLQTAVAEVLQAKKDANCRQRHLDNLEWYLGIFIKGRAQMDVSQITDKELREWFAARNEAPRSKRGHIGLLSTLFTHCWKRKYIAENPVRRLDTVKIERGIPKTLTNQQSRKSLIWAVRKKPQFLGWLVLALFVGLRPEAEADNCDWPNIDLDRGRIIIDKSKTDPRIIDLSLCPTAWEWLKLAKALGSPLSLTFVTRRRYIRALRDYLGFDRWPQDILRHTAASNLLAIHQDAGKVALFLGNSAGVLLRDYVNLTFKEDAQNFMSILPKPRHYACRIDAKDAFKILKKLKSS